MEKNEVVKDKPLEYTELEKELSALVEKNVLPPQLSKKLFSKLKEKNIKITKVQLDSFIGKIKTALRNAPAKPVIRAVTENGTRSQTSNVNGKIVDQQPGDALSSPDTGTMKTLVDAIEQLKNRLTELEKGSGFGKKPVSGRLVTTKDMQDFEHDLMSVRQEDIQPLTELSNDAENIIVLMKWLQHLVDRVGKTYLADVLSYYVDIGWITDDIRLDILRYSKGITDDGKSKAGTEPLALSTKDHIQSLLFIQKLKGIQVDERFIWRIDREMEKLGKTIDEYHLK